MAEVKVADIRNIVVLGHGGCGKTTLVEHLLHLAGAVNRAGSVDEGTSLSDYDPEEKARKFSIENAIFNFTWDGKTFNLIDTPGYLDFSGAAFSAIAAVETALIAVSAADGVQLNTRRLWDAASKAGLCRALLITRLDAENIQFDRLLDDIRESFGSECAPLLLPVGLGGSFKSVASLLGAGEAPEGVAGHFDVLRESLKESIIDCDDELTERYLEGEDIEAGKIEETFKTAVRSGKLVPILCCAVEKGIGLKEVLEFLATIAPSPEEGARRAPTDEQGEQVELEPRPDAPLCAQVFKSVTDAHVGRLAFLRLFSGRLGEGPTATVARTRSTARLGHLYSVFGAEHREVGQAVPGSIICVTKVEDMLFGDTLICAVKDVQTLPPNEMPGPMMSLAVEPHSRDDEQKISAGLQRLAEGDPTFTVHREEHSSELVITGMSNLHLEVMLGKLKGRYGVSADTHEPAIPYRETITRKGEGRYRHKKQTGGRGQYGEVCLRLEPNERGAGFEFIDEVKGGVIPQQYMPAVQKGIAETMAEGILAGCLVVDVKAIVYYGSYHNVDSSEAAFKIAGARAFQTAFRESSPVLLEPMAKIDVTIPAQFVGDVTGNLTGHRGRILGMDQVGGMQVLTAEIPMAELGRYSTELQSMTGGEGTFTLELSHYEIVPPHVQTQIVARREAERQKE